ncbi:MAG: hypothetical protein J0H29_17480 [Sphingobacteriales bacterium]|nr:hypothetical protein [Sphingobacteriales bacterium]
MFFPSTFPNIIDTDWKLNEKTCNHIASYITAFAKTGSDLSEDAAENVNNLRMYEWIPVWWNLRSIADKTIISFSLLSLFTMISGIKKIRKLGVTKMLCIITAITGTLFWFFLAPDPRFGFGFLLALIGIAADISFGKMITKYLSRYFLLLTVLNLVIGAYIIYRFNNYFSTRQIIYPMGISTVSSLVKGEGE